MGGSEGRSVGREIQAWLAAACLAGIVISAIIFLVTDDAPAIFPFCFAGLCILGAIDGLSAKSIMKSHRKEEVITMLVAAAFFLWLGLKP